MDGWLRFHLSVSHCHNFSAWSERGLMLNFHLLISWSFLILSVRGLNMDCFCIVVLGYNIVLVIPPLVERGLYCNHLVRPLVRSSICPSVHAFVKDVSATTGRNDFIFDTWLWHSDLYRVSPFQAYRRSTSCLPRDLEFFMFAVMKTFVTDISASTGRNDFIFDIWLLHGDLYCVSPFQVYCTSTSCLPCDLNFLVMSVEIYTNLTQMNEWGYS